MRKFANGTKMMLSVAMMCLILSGCEFFQPSSPGDYNDGPSDDIFVASESDNGAKSDAIDKIMEDVAKKRDKELKDKHKHENRSKIDNLEQNKDDKTDPVNIKNPSKKDANKQKYGNRHWMNGHPGCKGILNTDA